MRLILDRAVNTSGFGSIRRMKTHVNCEYTVRNFDLRIQTIFSSFRFQNLKTDDYVPFITQVLGIVDCVGNDITYRNSRLRLQYL